jgi:hypothetical protein
MRRKACISRFRSSGSHAVSNTPQIAPGAHSARISTVDSPLRGIGAPVELPTTSSAHCSEKTAD